MMHYMSVILCKCTMCCFHNLETPNSRTPGFDGCIESRIGTVYTGPTAKLQLFEKVFFPLRPFLCRYAKPLNSHTGLIRDDLAARELSWSMSVWRSAASWEPKLILNCYTDGYKTWRRARWHQHRRCDLWAARSTFFPVFFSFSRSHVYVFLSCPLLSHAPFASFQHSFFLSFTPSLYFSSTFSFSLLHCYFSLLFLCCTHCFASSPFFLSFYPTLFPFAFCYYLIHLFLSCLLLLSFSFWLRWGGQDDKYLWYAGYLDIVKPFR